MEERRMALLNLGVLGLTAVTAVVGVWSLHWARDESTGWRCRSGCILFAVNLVILGITGIVAASLRAQGLPPLGLVAGLLIVGMMWERPGPARQHREPLPQATVTEG
jgi:hypothetical protein